MNKYIKYLILLLPGLSILYLIKFNVAGLPTNVFEVLIYLCAIAAVIYNPGWRKLSKSEKLSIGLIGLISLISLIVSPQKRDALGIIKGWIVPAILVYWMLKNALDSESNVKIMLKAMAYQGVLVAIVAIAQQIPAVQQWWINQYPDLGQYLNTGRAVSLFNSPNAAAMILVPALIICWQLQSRSLDNAKPDKIDWLNFLIFIITALGLYETKSRGGFIALIVGLFVYILWIKRQRVWAHIIVAGTFLISNPIVYSILAKQNPDNMDIRVNIWQKSWELVQYNWFLGVGLGNFHNKFAEYTLHQPNYDEYITPYAVHPHNIILYIWLSFGLLGFLGFVNFIYWLHKSTLGTKSPLAILGAVLILTILIHGMIDLTIFKNDLIIWFVTALAMVKAKDRLNV
jgi:O-antigen ligase